MFMRSQHGEKSPQTAIPSGMHSAKYFELYGSSIKVRSSLQNNISPGIYGSRDLSLIVARRGSKLALHTHLPLGEHIATEV